MTSKTELFEYSHDDAVFEAYATYPDDTSSAKPCVLICHAWAGRSEHEEEVTKKIAALGYVGIAIDVYGKNKKGTSTEECQALMTPLVENRVLLQERLNAALSAAAKLESVDQSRIAVIGYCFGGLCALDMARSNLNILGAVSFHGLLGKPETSTEDHIKPKILALHGWDDPMATPDNVITFTEEMTSAKADWQLIAYGNTMHAFTNKEANDPDFGTVYSADADNRSWTSCSAFLKEIFI